MAAVLFQPSFQETHSPELAQSSWLSKESPNQS